MSKRVIKTRILVALGFFIVVMAVLSGRLFYLQIIKGPEYKQMAVQQQTKDSVVYSKRGTIYDRNGKALAVSVTAENVVANPAVINKKDKGAEVAQKLSEILEMDYDEVFKKVTKEKTNYQQIKLRVDKETADKVREAELLGISLELDSKREYTYDSLASFVIGFTGRDNQGLQGLEMIYDKELKGVPGRIEAAKNAVGNDMPYQYEKYIDPVDGQNLVLTIDETIQHFAEKYINEAQELYHLQQGARCIVMNPQNGEILAMAQTDNYNLNDPFTLIDEEKQKEIDALPEEERAEAKSKALNEMWRNKIVTDTYEPGSVFKMITTSMALEEGLTTIDDTFTCTGSKQYGPDNIKCWRYYNPHGTQNLIKGLQNSCNPVFMELGERLGPERFFKYYKAFGFTEPTGFEIPGEAVGAWHTEYKPVDLAVSSFGQSQTVTPLQMIAAASAVVNGGKLIKPHLVKQFTNSEGNVVKSVEPEVVRQVISEDTSAIMRMGLEAVVNGGTGSNAYIKGYRVGGKTGTSEKLPRGSGKKIASFMGFAPMDDPQVAVLVMLDEPVSDEKQTGQGGQIAAPTAGKILNDTLAYLNIQPQFSQEELMNMDVVVPDVSGMPQGDAVARLKDLQLNTKVVGSGDAVISQVPKGSATITAGSTVILYTEEQTKAKITVPKVTGLTAKEANDALVRSGLNFKISGVGATSDAADYTVVSQTPGSGEVVDQGTVIYVEVRKKDVD